MAKPILVANWKNRPGSLSEARTLLKELGKKRLLYKKLNLFVAPTLPYLESAAKSSKTFAQMASQDLGSPEILKSFGVRLSILGHSDRRAEGESSVEVAEKARVALKSGIVPLICIGETERDKDGEHFEFLREELKASLAGLNAKTASRIAIAYEPVWTIGKHAEDALPASELSESVIFIKKALSDLFGRKTAERIPILYGGSVEPENAGTLMRETGIKGFLVGHASLNAKSFEVIARSMLTKL